MSTTTCVSAGPVSLLFFEKKTKTSIRTFSSLIPACPTCALQENCVPRCLFVRDGILSVLWTASPAGERVKVESTRSPSALCQVSRGRGVPAEKQEEYKSNACGED